MIPNNYIDEWRLSHRWTQDEFVEQDFILSKILVDLYANDIISNALLFRGGTALHKLFLPKAYRYSEDLDFVQRRNEGIGPVLEEIQKIIVRTIPGKAKWMMHQGRVALIYRYEAENPPHPKMKIKIEINTREHFCLAKIQEKPFECRSSWFSGKSIIQTYTLEELLATKLRALYQRRKGRDLFDLWITRELSVDAHAIVSMFKEYMIRENNNVEAEQFMSNLQEKCNHPLFQVDIKPLIDSNINYSVANASEYVLETFLPHWDAT